MFGHIPRSKVNELVRLYEMLLRLHPQRVRYPQTWLAVNARIGDLREELGIETERPSQ